MEWQMSEPPVGKEIEFETDRRQKARGILRGAGGFGIRPGNVALDRQRLRRQYRADGVEQMMFEVLRWREAE